ncbi:MAG: hypothetical protein Q7U05_06970 [Polaromonas sp.]|nr:hypothetical protein [Polaromonas sp.]
MTAKELTVRLDAVVDYLRELEQNRLDEEADFEDELSALRLRVDELETLVADMQ